MTDPSIFGFLKKLRAKTIAGPSDLAALSNTFALPHSAAVLDCSLTLRQVAADYPEVAWRD